MTEDVEQRLVRYGGDFDRTIDRLADALAERARERPKRNDRLLVSAGVAAATTVIVVGAMLVATDRGSSPTDTVPSVTLDAPAVDTEPAPTSTPETSATAVPTTASLTLPDLSGTGGGLMLEPAAIPTGLLLTSADVNPLNDPQGRDATQTETLLASFNEDRSAVTAVISVRSVPATPEQVDDLNDWTPTELTVNGNTVYGRTSTDALPWQELVWIDGDRWFEVTERSKTADLSLIAQSLRQRPDGGYDVIDVPAGFEQVAVLNGDQTDRGHHITAYSVPRTRASDRPELVIYLVDDPGRPAEAHLAYNTLANEHSTAVDIGGRRMIITETGNDSATVIWDLDDGTQAQLEYNPTTPMTTDETKSAALELAMRVQRASATDWAAMQDQAAANHQQLIGD